MSCQCGCGNGCNNYTTPTSFSNVDISGSAIVSSTIAGSAISGSTLAGAEFLDTAVFDDDIEVAGDSIIAGDSDVTGDSDVGGDLDVTGDIMTDGVKLGYNVSASGVGTAYQLPNTAAAIDFGTTDPAIVIDKAGTYLVLGQVQLAYNAATVAAETATIKVRRTNNTAADVGATVVLDLPVATTLTHTYGIFQIPPFIYTTANTTDALTLFANVSAVLGAGTIDATAVGTALTVVRLY